MADRVARAYLGLGGNIGDASATIRAALASLNQQGARLLKRSADYETPPWGKIDQQPFINACAVVETLLSPHGLLDLCLKVERDLGRIRAEKWGPRIIDIDLLAYEQHEIDTPDLIIPHRYMLERAFVLVPLGEIAPDLLIGGKAVADHVTGFDVTGIRRLPMGEAGK